MAKEKLKIMVCTHKPDKIMYLDDVYMPVHAGKAISPHDLNIQGDDTGDNISAKNPYYCELTVQYWGWKNLDCEYIGLCHYRRYFECRYTNENIENQLKRFDIILPKPLYHTVIMENKLGKTLTLEDEAIFLQVIKKMSPEYERDVLKYLFGYKDIAFNMFICRKELFNEFANWQFSILQECEKYILLSGYTRLRRIYGYLGEYLLPIYCFHRKLKIKFVPCVFYENGKPYKLKSGKRQRVTASIKTLIHKHRIPQNIDMVISDAVKSGLLNDKIII